MKPWAALSIFAVAFLAARAWQRTRDADAFAEIDDMTRAENEALETVRATFGKENKANRAAFLAMIAFSEGTDKAGGYHALYGSLEHRKRVFFNQADHPKFTGEWAGVPLPDHMCAAAGLGPGCISTAAGRYQFIAPTWKRLRAKLSLRDFGADSQDLAALELVREAGALADVDDGRLDTALAKCRRIWASLPGAGYAQPERSRDALAGVYLKAGGAIA